MDGFADCTAADLTRRKWDSSVFPSLGTVNTRLGSTYFNGSKLTKAFSDPPYTTVSFGLAINTGNNFNGATPFVQLVNSTVTVKLSFVISKDGRVGFYIEGDAAGFRALALPQYSLHNNTWYYIAVTLSMTPVVVMSVRIAWSIALNVYVDGVAVISELAIVITTSADFSIYSFDLRAGGDVNTSHGVSDFFVRGGLQIIDDLDILENQRFKAPRVVVLRPIAEGAQIEFPTVEPSSPTTHYAKVDELLESQLDYTRATNTTCTPPVTDSFTHSQIPTVISSSSKKTLAAQFTFKGDITNTNDDAGHSVWPIHLVDGEEDELDFGGDVNSIYVEDAPGGSDPYTIAQANAIDSGVRLKLITP